MTPEKTLKPFGESIEHFGEGRADENHCVMTLYNGHEPDLDAKRQIMAQRDKQPPLGSHWSGGYYQLSSNEINFDAGFPVDLDDLQRALQSNLDSDKVVLTNHMGVLSMKIERSMLEEMIENYPKECKKCGFSRFHDLKYSANDLFESATFHCPYCLLETQGGWLGG